MATANSKPDVSWFPKYKWVGFDLDGTIADNSSHSSGLGEIGRPIRPMIRLMKELHKNGIEVRIVTARVSDVGDSAIAFERLEEHIGKWCDRNLGFRPKVTDRKDASMECLYDDRARQVVRNRGIDFGDIIGELSACLRLALAANTGRHMDSAILARCDKALNMAVATL